MKMYLPWKIWKMDFPANHVGLLEGNLFDVGYTFCARFHFFPLKLVILSSIPCGFQSKRCNELVFFVHICIIYKYLNIYNIYIYTHVLASYMTCKCKHWDLHPFYIQWLSPSKYSCSRHTVHFMCVFVYRVYIYVECLTHAATRLSFTHHMKS